MVKIRNQVTTGEFTSLFPVTDGTESRQITLDGFDKDKGVLVGVEMTVVATLISTAVFTDFFGFGSVATAYTAVYGQFGTGKGQPDMSATAVSLNGFGTTFVFPYGTASAPVNAIAAAVGIFTRPTQFKDDKDLVVTLDMAGEFTGYPFASLPQGDVIFEVGLTYSYVKPNDIINGSTARDKINGTAQSDVIFSKGGNDLIRTDAGDDYARAGGGKDKVIGAAGDDSLSGGKGDDRLFGGKGVDVMEGGTGADRMFGGNGNDVFYGGNETDKHTGGAGADVFVYTTDNTGGYITDFGRGDDRLDYTDFDIRKRDISIAYDESFDEVVVAINDRVVTVLENVAAEDVTNDMILV